MVEGAYVIVTVQVVKFLDKVSRIRWSFVALFLLHELCIVQQEYVVEAHPRWPGWWNEGSEDSGLEGCTNGWLDSSAIIGALDNTTGCADDLADGLAEGRTLEANLGKVKVMKLESRAHCDVLLACIVSYPQMRGSLEVKKEPSWRWWVQLIYISMLTCSSKLIVLLVATYLGFVYRWDRLCVVCSENLL